MKFYLDANMPMVKKVFSSGELSFLKKYVFQNQEKITQASNTLSFRRKIAAESQKNQRWKADHRIVKIAESYCSESTLHGLRYISDKSLSAFERIIWAVAFAAAFCFAVFYILQIFRKWRENPVLIAYSPFDANFHEIPFPSITICNMNQAKKAEAERIMRNGSPDEKDLLNTYCTSNQSEFLDFGDTSPTWNELQKFLIQVGQPCSEMLKSCFWTNSKIHCEYFFNNDFTDEGLCCSFNRLPAKYIFRDPEEVSELNQTSPRKIYDWTAERGFPDQNTGDIDTIPIRPAGSGTHLGLTVVLDAKVDDYFCSSTDSIGFKIVLSNPVETPRIADYAYLLSPGVEARFSIEPIKREATEALRTIDIEKRQCFFQNERPLFYYRVYTKRNCDLECISNYTLQQCGCIAYHLPSKYNTMETLDSFGGKIPYH